MTGGDDWHQKEGKATRRVLSGTVVVNHTGVKILEWCKKRQLD